MLAETGMPEFNATDTRLAMKNLVEMRWNGHQYYS